MQTSQLQGTVLLITLTKSFAFPRRRNRSTSFTCNSAQPYASLDPCFAHPVADAGGCAYMQYIGISPSASAAAFSRVLW
jgi:hypothetical protein